MMFGAYNCMCFPRPRLDATPPLCIALLPVLIVYVPALSPSRGGGYPDRLGGCPGSRHVGRVLQACRLRFPASRQTGRPAGMLQAGMVLQAWCFRLAADRKQQAGSRQAAGRQQAGRRQAEHPKK